MAHLKDFLHHLNKPFWLADPLFTNDDSPLPAVTDADMNEILNAARNHLGRDQVGRAINWLALGLRVRGDSFLSQVRRLGLLRPSKYGFVATAIHRAALTLREHADVLHLSEPAKRYLGSVCTLATLASGVLQRQQSILAFIRANRIVALKGFLATVDFMFMREKAPNRSTSTDDIAFYSKEDLAEGLSFIINLFAATFGLSDRDLALLDAEAVASEEYGPCLVDACVIRKFQEWEILVDVLGWEVTSDGDGGDLVVCSPDVALAKSLRLGYIQADMQAYVHQGEIERHRALSVKSAGDEFYRNFGHRFVEYASEPIPRYRYHVPLIPEFLQFFSDDALFRDELFAVSAAAKDNLSDFEDILRFRILEDLSFFELLKVQRLFNFLRSYAAAHLAEVLGEDRPIVFRSLVPRFGMTDLLDILGRVIPRHKAPYVVDLLTWRRNSGRVFDIQYQPIFALDDVATVPMNILASSNIVRNSLQLVRDRIYGSDADDPVSRFVDDALTGAGWKTRTKLKYSFSGVSGEIDVLSLINSVLFVFECKNSLHPCNMYEIRTTWDHLKRAGEQLGRFLGLWVTRGFHEYLSSLVGWSIPADTRVQTAVVSGNRMFTGYRVEGNPVRSVYELTAFIAEGTVRIGNEVKCFWAGETVTPGDLVAYLKDDLVHKPHFDAMEAVRHRYRIGRATIYEEVFVLNVLGVAGRLGFDVAKLAAEDADLAL